MLLARKGREQDIMTTHYVLLRYEHGWGSGPGSGVQAPDTYEVMAASRTQKGLRRKQRELGGHIERVDGPYRRYEHNEFFRYARV
jgi:hypothetical protein